MKLFQFSIATGLVVIFLAVPRANANFLGLAPGDYVVTLSGTSAACGGVNCTGTVHIGSPLETNFSWNFTIGTDVFNFGGAPGGADTGISPSGTNTVACESNTNAMTCDINDSGGVLQNGLSPELVLSNSPALGFGFGYIGQAGFINNAASAAPISAPEPVSGTLLLFGLSALGLWRRFTVKQN